MAIAADAPLRGIEKLKVLRRSPPHAVAVPTPQPKRPFTNLYKTQFENKPAAY